jgi:hypothetical protein
MSTATIPESSQAELDWLRETFFQKATNPTDPPPPPNSSTTAGTGSSHKLDVEKWLTARGVPFRKKSKPSIYGQVRWCIDCPFDPTHGDPDACIFQSVAGKTGFRCFHASCSGNRWKEARDKIGKPDGKHYDPPIIRVTFKGGKAKEDTAHHSHTAHLPPEREWPEPLAPEAFVGPLADYVRAVEPATESDPAALLAHSLVMFGNVIGRTAFLSVEADRHHTNENLVVVGETAGGRKGTAAGVAKTAFALADETWLTDRTVSGLSSGEGLSWFVRDPIEKMERVKEKGEVRYEKVVADLGVEDKRAMVIEPEFVGALKQNERQGNTLSAIIRQAWESGCLRSLTKNSPAKATDAHISIIGHITEAELKKYLTEVETANGYANRFLWTVVRRSKFLPKAPAIDADAVNAARNAIASAVKFGKTQRRIERDAEAEELWGEVYQVLERDRGGLTGAMLARAASHVNRLSFIYALSDCSPVIRVRHLAAAVAFWEFTERSVAYLFGDSTGDGIADDALTLLRACPTGINRGDISNFFARHVSSDRLSQALRTLVRFGRARFEMVETGGRPAERWYATKGGRP